MKICTICILLLLIFQTNYCMLLDDEDETLFDPFNPATYSLTYPSSHSTSPCTQEDYTDSTRDIIFIENSTLTLIANILQRHFKPKFDFGHSLFYPDLIFINKKIPSFINELTFQKYYAGKILLICCEKNFTEAASFLVNQCEAPLNYQTSKKQNILHLAAGHTDNHLTEVLLNKLKDDYTILNQLIQEKDSEQNTPLDIAAKNHNFKFPEILSIYQNI